MVGLAVCWRMVRCGWFGATAFIFVTLTVRCPGVVCMSSAAVVWMGLAPSSSSVSSRDDSIHAYQSMFSEGAQSA
jgi:hypothetical protein